MLAADDRDQWIRLIGSEAQPPQGTVRLRPDLNAAWRSMFETLITSGQLAESANGAWTQGMTRLPDGLFAAEILIDGVCWVAIRPLGLPGGELPVQADTIEDAIARGHRDGDHGTIDPFIVGGFFPTLAGATPPEISREQV